MPLIRGHHSFDDQFTQIPNEWLRDKRLSLATRGLLAQIMSHRPGWSITLENLAFANDIGRDAIRTCINQLLEVGYLTRSNERERNSRGQVAGYVYTTQTPPMQDEPTVDYPTQGKLPLKKNNPLEEQLKETNAQILEPEFNLFWELYPRKVGKKAARLAYSKAVSSNGSLEILTGTKRLLADPNLPEPQFIPHPATWLNEGRWDDEPYPERKKTPDQVIESGKKKLERDKEITQSIIAEMQESKAKTSAPPKCQHGNSIVSCKACLKALN